MTILENAEMRIRILLRALLPVVCLWYALYLTRSWLDPGEWVEDHTTAFRYRFSEDHSWWFLVGHAPVILVYWWLHGAMIRSVRGKTLFAELCEESGGNNEDGPSVAFLMFVGMLVLAIVLSWALYLLGIVSLVCLIAAFPVAIKLGSKSFMDAEKNRFRKLVQRRKDDARRRMQRPVPRAVPTFESRMLMIERDHNNRVSQLRRIRTDEAEREYLLELEESRFHEQIRKLIDPTLQD